MRITFVALGMEQLAVSQLAAIAKKEGHEVGLAFSVALFHDRNYFEHPSLARFFDDHEEVIQAIKEQKPEVLALSCITATYQWMLKVARETKEIFPNVKTVFGGVHISAVPERALAKPEVDYVVVGEGDIAFPLILDAIETGDFLTPIPNTRFKTPEGKVVRGIQQGFIQDLDSLPIMDKSIWEDYVRVGDLYLTMASRGCPYTCSFCFNNFYSRLPEEKRGKYVRQRSVEHVMHELTQAKRSYKLQFINFQDDVFTVNKGWVKEFSTRYRREINVPFECLIHPQYFDDEIATWLSDAGCVWIQMGIQTMDEDFKHEKLRRYEESDHIVKALESMHRHGIKIKVDHMLGLPGEPIGSQETALKLYAEQTPERIQTFWTCFLPGTDMMKEGIANGILNEQQAERLYEGLDFYFYRNEESIKDESMIKIYRRYQFIYRILPSLPRFVRGKIKPKQIKWMPAIFIHIIAFICDSFQGLRYSNPDFVNYRNHYAFHLYRFILKKLGFKPPVATMPRVISSLFPPIPLNRQAEDIQLSGKQAV